MLPLTLTKASYRARTLIFFISSLSFSVNAQQATETDDLWNDDDWLEETPEVNSNAFRITGFGEILAGQRITESEFHSDTSAADIRLRLETKFDFNDVLFSVKSDSYYDHVLGDLRGDFRDLTASYSFNSFDLKAGRQILTWGTGDFLFLNDFFPKDWQSFFSGRDDEYLKAPSDSVKLSGYFSALNIDLVWVPEFDSDNYLTGDYYSFFNPQIGNIDAPKFLADAPNDDEIAVRIYKTLNSTELAAYFYDGFFKSPNAVDDDGELTFSRLRSVGFSARSPWQNGLVNIETSYLRSLDDSSGRNPLISNSQWRFLLGYERELFTRLTGSAQIYLERTLNYDNLIRFSAQPQFEPEENRTLTTVRLSWRNANEKLRFSLFTFYSPSDEDTYWRIQSSYRPNDRWLFTLGMNWFDGAAEDTFFGQLTDNKNAYLRLRLSF